MSCHNYAGGDNQEHGGGGANLYVSDVIVIYLRIYGFVQLQSRALTMRRQRGTQLSSGLGSLVVVVHCHNCVVQ